MRELLAPAFEIVHFEAYLTTTDCKEIMGTILQGFYFRSSFFKNSNENEKIEDTTESPKASNIGKNNLAVKEIKSTIENSLNPFNKNANPDHLFNICTGKSCKEGPEDFL